MFRTLQARLIFFFIVVSLTGIIFVSLAIHLGLQDSFYHYLDLKREEQVKQVRQLLQAEYEQFGVITGGKAGMLLHQQAMTENLFYQVYDVDGRLTADSTNMMGMMGMMGGRMMSGRMMRAPENLNNQELLAKTYPLKVKGEDIGFLKVYHFQGYVETDFQFLGKINKYIFLAALTMIVVAILLSLIFSKKLTQGLNQMRDAARQLQQHNLAVRIPLNKQQTEEMQELAVAFNDLAKSLSQQEKLRKQFTGDLAHELRTPLTTLRSQLEAFEDGVWEPTPARLKQSHEELMRLVRLVDDLEQLLAAENPQIILNKERLEAGEMLAYLREYFLPAFLEKQVALHLEQPAAVLWFQADRDRFMQIMANLLNNALKYTPAGGQVILAAAKGANEEQVEFQVQDTGSGIAKEHLAYLFERFYRGDKSRDRKTGGIGIGLSVVQALVQAHQGKIKIESELGQGTKVLVAFTAA